MVSERNGEACFGAEGYEEELVPRVSVAEKRVHGLTCLGHLGGHAAAGIEHDADTRRRILRREVNDVLRGCVLEQRKVFLLQTGDSFAVVIGDGYRDENQIGMDQ